MDARKKQEVLVAALMTALGMACLASAMQIREASRLFSGSRVLPVAAATLMIAFAVLRGLSVLRGAGEGEGKAALPAVSIPKWAAGIAAIVLYAVMLEYAGFLLTTALLLTALGPFFGIRALWANLAVSASITVAIWVLFAKVFGAHLPLGTLL